jgi:hypothetical protein
MSAANAKRDTPGSVKTDVKRAGQKVAYSPLVEAMTRLGYGVRGIIYVTMGLLALNVALGKGNAPVNQQSAIAAIGKQPAGLVLLWVILIGLVCYSLWGVIRAVMDPLHKGHDLKGLLTRFGFLISAAAYAYFIMPTYSSIKGADSTSQSGAQTQGIMASIMSKPGGHWLVGVVGLAVLAVGLYQIYQGFKNSFDKEFQTYTMSSEEKKVAKQMGRFGVATRGFIFAILGGLIMLAAYQSNSSQSVGIDAALNALLHQPYGVWLLGIAAIGLMAFGLYSMLSAAWFRLKR